MAKPTYFNYSSTKRDENDALTALISGPVETIGRTKNLPNENVGELRDKISLLAQNTESDEIKNKSLFFLEQTTSRDVKEVISKGLRDRFLGILTNYRSPERIKKDLRNLKVRQRRAAKNLIIAA